ncbi:winged helix-turn-helix domain-containing protein [Alteromonas stellipolaris]|uniref:winged helix-turn-helix domain-containing protein n=1 Tax=Alteromonas stellipolaris TaxID=233316 RepID=UPI00356843DD
MISIEKYGNLDWLGSNIIIVGDYAVDFKKSRISRGEERIKLEPLAMELLCYLVSRKGEYVSQRELLKNVWGGRVVSDNAIRRVVKKLRDALGDEPRDPKYIKTVPNKGYLLIADVVIDEHQPIPPIPKTAIEADQNETSSTDLKTFQSKQPQPVTKTSDKHKTRKLVVLTLLTVFALIFALYLLSSTVFKSDDTVSITSLMSMPGEEHWTDYNAQNSAIIFSHRKTANGFFDLYLRTADKHTIRKLTNGGANHNAPSWSNDGKKIAYQRQLGDKAELVILSISESMKVEKSEVIYSYDSLQPSLDWSPDDSSLYFAHRQSIDHPYSIFSINITTREITQITFPNIGNLGDYAAQFSPDGRFLATFRYLRYGLVHLIIVDVTRGKILSDRKVESTPITLSWNNKSTGVYFSTKGKLHFFNNEKQSFTSLPIEGYELKSVFAHCGNDCLIANTADDNNRDVKELANPFFSSENDQLDFFELPMLGDEGHPIYSNDPDEVVFRAVIKNTSQIVSYSAQVGLEVLTQFDRGYRINNLQFNPKQDLVLGLQEEQIFVLDVGTGNIEFVSKQMENAQRPNWSDDGQSIYYSRRELGTTALIKYNLQSGEHERLLENIIEAKEDKGGRHIYLLNNDGELHKAQIGNLEQSKFIGNIPIFSNISWHIFDHTLYYSAPEGKNFTLNKIDMQTKQTTTIPWLKNTYYAKFELHSSGKKLLLLQENTPSTELVEIRNL